MRYLLLIYDAEAEFGKLSEKQINEMMAQYEKLTTDLKESGSFVGSHRLRPVSTATAVRVRNGETLLTDGPFAETKEQLGGYYLVDVKDLDEALQWAAKIPSARFGTIEVRPVWE
ncbi:MAG: YciI family protein [Acidobacteriota bacterium]